MQSPSLCLVLPLIPHSQHRYRWATTTHKPGKYSARPWTDLDRLESVETYRCWHESKENSTAKFYVLLTVHPCIISQINPTKCTILLNTLRTGDADLRFLHYNCARRMTQICVFNTRLFSLHNTLNYAIHRACLRIVLLTDVYRNLTSLWINL